MSLSFQAFGRALRRPALFHLPERVVDFMFSKERAVILTKGAAVLPKRTLESGFNYSYPTISEACAEVSKIFML